MNKLQMKEIPMQNVIDELGLNTELKRNMRCLFPTHEDKNPSAQYDKTKNIFSCHSRCGTTLDNIDIVRRVEGLSFPETSKWFDEHFGAGIKRQPVVRSSIVVNPTQTKSAPNDNIYKSIVSRGVDLKNGYRGIKNELFARFQIKKYNKEVRETMFKYLKEECGYSLADLKDCGTIGNFCNPILSQYQIIVPYFDDGKIITLEGKRPIDETIPKTKLISSPTLFNIDLLKEMKDGEELFVAEGMWDTLSLIQMGKKAVGLPGWNHFNRFAVVFKRFKVKMILDNDEAGEKLGDLAKELLPDVQIIKWKDKEEGYDVNQYLQDGGTNIDEIMGLVVDENKMAKKIQTYFDERQGTPHDKLSGLAIPNWKTFQNKMDGVQAGVYVVGGSTFAGKTAFLVNLLVELMDANEDLVAFFFSQDLGENSIQDRLQACNGEIDISQARKKQTDTNIENIKHATLLKMLKWANDGRFVLTDQREIATFDAIEKMIEKYKREKMVVFIDGANYIRTGQQQGLDKDNEIATRLTKIAITNKCPVFGTLEMRKRAKADDEKTDEDYFIKFGCIEDFKGSISIVYQADVVAVLHPNETGWLDRNRPDVKYSVFISKNRLNGYAGEFHFNFHKRHNKIKEADENGITALKKQIKKVNKQKKDKPTEYEKTTLDILSNL